MMATGGAATTDDGGGFIGTRKRPRRDGGGADGNHSAGGIKLLLHGEGGSPPYLTPHLLATCFPPPTPGDGADTCEVAGADIAKEEEELTRRRRRRLTAHLIFGIEMRDSCVVPVYPTSPASDGTGTGTGAGTGGCDTNGEVVAAVGAGDEKPTPGDTAVEIQGGDDGKSSGGVDAPRSSGEGKDRGNKAERRRGRRRAGGGTMNTQQGRRVVVDPTKPIGFEFGVRRGLAPDAASRHLGIPPGYETMVLSAYDVIDSYVQSSKSSVGGKGVMPMMQMQRPQPRCTATEMVLPTPHGHQKLGCPRQFLDCVDRLGATTAVAPYDQQDEDEDDDGGGGGRGGGGDESKSSSKSTSAGSRRVERSVERTALWLDKLLEEGQDGGAGGGIVASSRPSLWGAVVGGGRTDARRASARAVARHTGSDRLCGAALVGLHRIRDRRRRVELMKACLDELGGCGLSTVIPSTGEGGIVEVLDAGLAGVDVIGSDLPARLARRGMALVLDLRGWRTRRKEKGRHGGDDTAIDGGGAPDGDDSAAEPPPSCYYIDLNDPVHARDKLPLLDGCDCFSCRPSLRDDPSSSPDDDGGGGGGNLRLRRRGHYTRAYVHHLLNVGELLAEILLFAHNLHHLLLLFEEMSSVVVVRGRGGSASAEEDVDRFRRHVEAQVMAPGRDADAKGAGSPSS